MQPNINLGKGMAWLYIKASRVTIAAFGVPGGLELLT